MPSMSERQDVPTLACAWRPRGERSLWQAAWPQLRAVYGGVIIALPSDADTEQAKPLAAMPDALICRATRPFWARHEALGRAVEAGAACVHYADGDRLLHWIETRPEEWRSVVAEITQTDCLIIGRNKWAFSTHPQAMQQTETIINDVASHLLGQPVDLGGGSRGLSVAAAEALLAHATPGGYGDAEWPILLRRLGFRVAYRSVHGLDWETPDHYQHRVADSERQRQVAADYDSRADRWAARVRTAHEIVDEALRAATRPLPILMAGQP